MLYHSPLSVCIYMEICFFGFMCQWEFVYELLEIHFYLMYVFSRWGYELPIRFLWEESDLSLGSLDPCYIQHSIHFLCDYFSCYDVGWPSLTILSLCFPLSLFHYFISFCLIWFLSFLNLLDVQLRFNIHTLFLLILLIFDMSIPLLSLFMWKPLGLGLMRFSMDCILCMRGMGIVSLGLLSIVSFSFFHPITLAYISSKVLSPPWGHDSTHCVWRLTYGWYLRLLGTWWMRSYDVVYTRATPLIGDGFLRWCVLH